MSNSLKGTLLTVVAGIAWGLSGTSGQYLMAHGISALVLTNLRLLIAGGILMLLAYATAKDKILVFLKDRKSLLSLLIFALIGLFLNQFAYLSAIQETNAGTATVLQYVCPVGILIYSCIKDRVATDTGRDSFHHIRHRRNLPDRNTWAVGPVIHDTCWSVLGSLFCLDLCFVYHFTHSLD